MFTNFNFVTCIYSGMYHQVSSREVFDNLREWVGSDKDNGDVVLAPLTYLGADNQPHSIKVPLLRDICENMSTFKSAVTSRIFEDAEVYGGVSEESVNLATMSGNGSKYQQWAICIHA